MVRSVRQIRTAPRRFSLQRGLRVLAGLLAIALIIVPGASTPAHADNAMPALEVGSADLDFGDVPVGDRSVLDVVFTNVSSSTQVLSMAGGGIGHDTDFSNASSVEVTNCIDGADLAPGDSCAWAFAFQPQSLGEQDDSTAI